MKTTKNIFPPPSLADLGRRGAQNFLSLVRSIQEGDFVLALGSGASSSVGLPIWSELLKRLSLTFFRHWEMRIDSGTGSYVNPPRNMSIAFVEDENDPIWALVNEMGAHDPKYVEFSRSFSAGDPLIVAQQIKTCIREQDWRYLLYHALYLNHTDLTVHDIKSQLLDSLANLCSKNNCVKSVLNYNYDNSFEIHLRRNSISCRAFWDPAFPEKAEKLAIYHPHGYLPFPGGPLSKTVIAESDYHGEYAQSDNWANLAQFREFTGSTCLFIGHSMTDPNLRRILRSSKPIAKRWHYAFLPKESTPTKYQSMSYALFDSDLTRTGIRVIRFPKKADPNDPYGRLCELIELLSNAISDKDSIWNQ